MADARNGFAELHVGKVQGLSTLLRSRARSPVCLLAPQPRGPSVWAFTSTLGGGMVAGDEVSLQVTVDSHSRCFLGTQASTKIYRNPQKRPCSHSLNATIGAGALLALAPDPVQCFAEASYEQRQTFDLAPDSNLILVDWLSGGRIAREERWAFERYFSRNEIRRENQTILLDAIDLDARSGSLNNPFRTGRFNCLATLVILGPELESHAAAILRPIEAQPVTRRASLVCSASPLSEGALLRFAGSSVEEVGHAVHGHLRFLPELLHDDPWARKW